MVLETGNSRTGPVRIDSIFIFGVNRMKKSFTARAKKNSDEFIKQV